MTVSLDHHCDVIQTYIGIVFPKRRENLPTPGGDILENVLDT
jgi:hypothetical protein